MVSGARAAAAAGADAIALKPAETDLIRLDRLDPTTVVVDFEGAAHLPPVDVVARLAERHEVVLTAPVRADGFDPLGDDTALDRYAGTARFAFVAGHPGYLGDAERRRGVAPRLCQAVGRHADAWVGTEGIERIALATGATQYELLSGSTPRTIRALRAAGFEGDVVVYAPTVVADDPDVALDAVGGYVARRKPVARRLDPDGPTDADATGRTRRVLLDAVEAYAIVGDPADVRSRIDALRRAGASAVVSYPARAQREGRRAAANRATRRRR